MKRIITSFVFAVALFGMMSASAQKRAERPDYSFYGFWSNWSIGGTIDLNREHQMGYWSFGDNWRVSTNVGFDLFAQKKMSYLFDMRLRFGFPTLGEPRARTLTVKYYNFEHNRNEQVNDDNYPTYMNRHFTTTLDWLWSISNTFLNPNPDRRWNFYLVAGTGLCFSGNAGESTSNYTYVGVDLNGGAGISYHLGSSSNLMFEYGVDISADVPHIFKEGSNWHHTNGIFRLGYFYDLGVTATDKKIAAQKAMLTEENFKNLNRKVNSLEDQVDNARATEQKLEGKINDLEQQLADAEQWKRGQQMADSLQGIIDGIKNDQINYYAIPFSVLYATDQWHVPQGQMRKLKAIAKVMKDNPDLKLLVVGFCDLPQTDEYNMRLSERRAKEAKRVLVETFGVDEDRLIIDFKGRRVWFGDPSFSVNRRTSFYRVIE